MNLETLIKVILGGAVTLLCGLAVLGAIFILLRGLVEEVAEWLGR